MNGGQRGVGLLRAMATTVALLALTACQYTKVPTQVQMDIYLLMGQSNMSGRGLLNQAVSDDRFIRVYGNDGLWKNATEPLDSAVNQVDPVSADAAAGIGPGLFFAQALRKERPDQAVGLVPCAKGGTSITQWARSDARTTLYGSCLARAREVMGEGRIAGILWYQGETDADGLADADAWSERFSAMISSFRHDLGQPGLPLVVVGLGDRPMTGRYADRFKAWSTVQVAQARLRLPRQAFVSAAGLSRNDDQLHLSMEGQAILGPRLAGAMVALQSPHRP